ncbi:related to glutamate carboxypeptidase II [Ramularia collo-cygni]|uniref:Related to glutamate carboxypeptidase II n=1 Tax=Ramularia collo-cygni TaxID=112498 RepID=A0A2D3VDT4_9PEZI|nr:related to glutamate carboxypeptidase II [Ramularia collo-cygni]CZT23232.1 related to glutamate carboxypeptidase II [Ramularia collo-cygni]
MIFSLFLAALLGERAVALPSSFEIKGQSISSDLTINEDLILKTISNDSIANFSYYYTQGLHLAGTNQSQAQWTADRWSEFGFNSRLDVYNVFLNYPLDNSLNATWTNGSTYSPVLEEDILEEDPVTGFPNRVPTFHAYSASGTAEAEYVYVGRGQIADFERLKELGIELEGKIAVSRYGGPFRGIKVQNAQAYGMIGCVLFNDLADDGEIKVENGYEAYPDGPARNPTYVQRGSVLFLSIRPGDPTTPGYPSKPGVERAARDDVTPAIPSLPISYANAGPLLAALEGFGSSGEEVNRTNWVGDHDVGYFTGPAPGVTLGLSNLMNETYTDIWNAIGIINGTDPTETIILGNHRDAWMIGGAGDPISGSASVNEVAKALGALMETGWKPKRNIVLASWDAEEYGLVGSTEWVEEFLPWLSDTAVTYINLDTACNGPIPDFSATPELHQIGIDTMKKVQWPGTNGTMYDAWYNASEGVPGVLGSGSDYTAFLHKGISSFDVGSGGGPTDPVFMYHSNYDTYEWMARFGDPGFHVHAAMSQYVALLTYTLASEEVVPFNVSNFATQMDAYYEELQEIIKEGGEELDTTALSEAIDNFRVHALEAETLTAQAVAEHDLDLIAVQNKKYKDFHRGFIATPGLPGRQFFRHAVFAPGRDTGYAPVTFPGITEAITFDGNYTLAAEWVDATAEAINIAGDILAT